MPEPENHPLLPMMTAGKLPQMPPMAPGATPGANSMMPRPPIVPLNIECELLLTPMTCSLQATRGSCAWLAGDQKCDIADKCDGRDRASCALYWKGNRMGPNCVWLAMEEKCDSSTKCYGRDRATCTNPAFPKCTWTAPYVASWGQNFPGGMCTEYEGPQNPFAQMFEGLSGGLQATHMQEPASDSTNSSKHISRNVVLISVGSFLLSAMCTYFVMRKRQQTSESCTPL